MPLSRGRVDIRPNSTGAGARRCRRDGARLIAFAGKNITFATLVATALCTAGAILVAAVAYLYSVGDPTIMRMAEMAFPDDGRPEGFMYYETDPDYFDSLNWVSVPQQGDRSRANDDGSLSEWADHWYIAHRDSGYGEVMARLEAGAVVTVDGRSVRITGKGMVGFPSKVGDVLALAGDDYDMILLTCVNDGPTPEETQHLWVLWG